MEVWLGQQTSVYSNFSMNSEMSKKEFFVSWFISINTEEYREEIR